VRGRRRSGSNLDWVYRSDRYVVGANEQGDEEIPLDVLEQVSSGTYGTVITAVVNSERLALVLVDSQRNMRDAALGSQVGQFGTSSLVLTNPAANPDTAKDGPGIHGVDVEVYMYGTVGQWSGQAAYYTGMRIIIAEQDPFSGRAMLHTNYEMWALSQGGLDTLNSNPAEYANGRQNCWEHRHYHDRRDDASNTAGASVYRARPRFRRRLNYEEGLFLYLENHPNSVDLEFIQVFCRTLVSPPTRR